MTDFANKKPGSRPGSLHSTERGQFTSDGNGPPEDMRRFRIGLFTRDWETARNRLTPAELHAYVGFLLEYVYDGARGLVDDDADLARRIRFKGWPTLKAKLHTLGFIYTVDGLIRDKDADVSIGRQRDTSALQSVRARRGWDRKRAGGAA